MYLLSNFFDAVFGLLFSLTSLTLFSSNAFPDPIFLKCIDQTFFLENILKSSLNWLIILFYMCSSRHKTKEFLSCKCCQNFRLAKTFSEVNLTWLYFLSSLTLLSWTSSIPCQNIILRISSFEAIFWWLYSDFPDPTFLNFRISRQN